MFKFKITHFFALYFLSFITLPKLNALLTTGSTLDQPLSTRGSTLDHTSYCKCKAVQNEVDDADCETDLHDLMKHFNQQTFLSSTITKSIENVCRAGNSILFVKDPGELTKKNWFREVSIEMSEKCTEVFQILFAAVGMFYFTLKYKCKCSIIKLSR